LPTLNIELTVTYLLTYQQDAFSLPAEIPLYHCVTCCSYTDICTTAHTYTLHLFQTKVQSNSFQENFSRE